MLWHDLNWFEDLNWFQWDSLLGFCSSPSVTFLSTLLFLSVEVEKFLTALRCLSDMFSSCSRFEEWDQVLFSASRLVSIWTETFKPKQPIHRRRRGFLTPAGGRCWARPAAGRRGWMCSCCSSCSSCVFLYSSSLSSVCLFSPVFSPGFSSQSLQLTQRFLIASATEEEEFWERCPPLPQLLLFIRGWIAKMEALAADSSFWS